jgi:hypothetical protein
MKFSEVVRRRIRHSKDGVNVVADINAAVSGAVNEPGGKSSVSTRQKVVHRSGAKSKTSTRHRAK